MHLLEVKNLKVKIEGKDILKGLNLSVNPGEVHAIMGPNGSGKVSISEYVYVSFVAFILNRSQ